MRIDLVVPEVADPSDAGSLADVLVLIQQRVRDTLPRVEEYVKIGVQVLEKDLADPQLEELSKDDSVHLGCASR